MVQENCLIDEGTSIINSVIGKNCKIGRNCVLENAYIFDNVEIAENCTIRRSVLGAGVKLLQRSVIENGTIIGSNAIIPENSAFDKQLVTASEEADEGQ